ncbi:Minor extracellular protease vpr [Mycena venus]|uniref:Minor extracellular protease vpr n=1 Tax=Mycena venus TaxID=2733690 RepID=A0A8H6YG54_9AGAR|nr:Minor extracellular protease vpr [Mycena venus]
MKAALSFALFGATSALAAKSLSSVQRVTNLPIVSNKFIVEVAETSDIPSKRDLGTPHEQLYRSLKERKIAFDVHKEYDAPGIFVGAAMTLTDSQDVASILKTNGVVAIRPVRSYPRPAPVFSKTCSPGDAGLPDSESTHITTGVDKLHAKGITGKGIKIGILDTGIDYTHPALGGGFGAGFKVQGGYDLVGDDYTGANAPVPDSDPLDQCAGHGSYYILCYLAPPFNSRVLDQEPMLLYVRPMIISSGAITRLKGIIGANPGNEFNISGVAYDSTIYAYRIFGCNGSVNDDVIVDGLLMGVKAGMDILTMSLGGSDGWSESTGSVVSSRIAASGKIVTIAAGNEGASGSWFTSSPGNAIDAISVASSDNTIIPLQSFTVDGVTHDPIVYYDTFPLPVTETLPLYATSNDTTVVDDACNPLPASTPDLSGFVVLVRRGTCAFVDKLANIAAFGAKTALIYDNGNGFAGIEVGNFSAVLIQAEDGVFLGQQLAAGKSIKVTFPQSGAGVQFPSTTGGLVSTFTTYGPTNDFYFKPAITAPGGDILSTYPIPLGTWRLDSGTSMATPFLAGSAALFLSVKGKSPSVARSARTFFQATAKPISSSLTDGDPFQTVTQQGAGLVQVYDAIFGTTTLSRTELILNDTAHFAGPQKFTVKNTGKTVKTYTLSHVPAGTAVTIGAGSILPALGPVPLSTSYASVKFNSGKFTLLPGQAHDVVATITPPKGVDATTFPVYSGFIHVTSPVESVHATYLGLAASLKDKQVVDNTDIIFGVNIPALLDSAGNVQDGPVNYTFVGADAPTMLWRQAFGTPLLRLDLVSANTSFAPTLNSRAAISFATSHKGGSFAKVSTLGPLLEQPYLGRNDEGDLLQNTFVLSNTFANGTTISNGSYKVLLRALRVTGDPTNEADYESWLSPIFGVAA